MHIKIYIMNIVNMGFRLIRSPDMFIVDVCVHTDESSM